MICQKYEEGVLYCNSKVSQNDLNSVQNKFDYSRIVTRTKNCLNFDKFTNLRLVQIMRRRGFYSQTPEHCFCSKEKGQLLFFYFDYFILKKFVHFS